MHLQIFWVKNPPYFDQMSKNLLDAYSESGSFMKLYTFLYPLHEMNLLSYKADVTILKLFIIINCLHLYVVCKIAYKCYWEILTNFRAQIICFIIVSNEYARQFDQLLVYEQLVGLSISASIYFLSSS